MCVINKLGYFFSKKSITEGHKGTQVFTYSRNQINYLLNVSNKLIKNTFIIRFSNLF